MTDLRIQVYGNNWCPDCRRAREIFKKLNVDYDWIDTDLDMTARKYVMNINHGNCSVPTIVFPDGSIIVEPSSTALATKLSSLI